MITWEAIEHQGRGIYDQHYLEYLTRVVELAGEYGLYVIIDPHQVPVIPLFLPALITIGLVVATITSLFIQLTEGIEGNWCYIVSIIISYHILSLSSNIMIGCMESRKWRRWGSRMDVRMCGIGYYQIGRKRGSVDDEQSIPSVRRNVLDSQLSTASVCYYVYPILWRYPYIAISLSISISIYTSKHLSHRLSLRILISYSIWYSMGTI